MKTIMNSLTFFTALGMSGLAHAHVGTGADESRYFVDVADLRSLVQWRRQEAGERQRKEEATPPGHGLYSDSSPPFPHACMQGHVWF